MDLKQYDRDIPDFPKEGVIFKDITPLLMHSGASFQQTLKALLGIADHFYVDKVVGMESRGLFFAPILAAELNAGFVPVRKLSVGW